MNLLDGFVARAALAGLGVALAAGPLGCFVVWRRIVYFGDAVAHASILGIALSLVFSAPVFAGALAAAIVMALAVSWLSARGMAADTALGVLAHAALAAGVVAVTLIPGVRVDLVAYLFGDILAVGTADLAVIWGGALLVLGLLAWRWQALLTVTLSPELARAHGIDPRREEVVLTLALALMVAVAIKVVGILLIAALLIIPAAAARPFVRTPETMAIAAILIAAGSTLAGLLFSLRYDTPTGPSMVCAAAALFLVSLVLRAALSRRAA